jgi:BirA family transcriptional regulator, biotin operon repressor / biotin---[acetyl-CoA-carboxylase] ligase
LFAQTLPVPTRAGRLIVLSTVESSNNYAMAKLHAGMVKHADCFLALEQSAGKGQRGKHWKSAPGKNITISAAISLPQAFSAATITKLQSFPFLFSAAIALTCYDFIKASDVTDIKIKWPNDLYIGDRKAGGILIENSIRSGDWQWSIIGIGINLNQDLFDAGIPNATSLKQATMREFDLIACTRQLASFLVKRLHWLNVASAQEVMVNYNQHLYKAQQDVRLRKDNAVFSTTILHVDTSGRLHTSDVINRTFSSGEVEFINA